MLLVRKIEKAKWHPEKKLKLAHVPGDAITGSMRTFGNNLSLWKVSIDKKEKMINEGVLALVTGPKQDQLESIDVILLEPRELEKRRLEFIQQDEPTYVDDFKHAHWNILNLTYCKLGVVAKLLLNKIHKGQAIRVTRMNVVTIVIEAIIEKRLDFNNLHDKIKIILIKALRQDKRLLEFKRLDKGIQAAIIQKGEAFDIDVTSLVKIA